MMGKYSHRLMNDEHWMQIQPQFNNPNIRAVFSFRSFPTNGEDGRRLFAEEIGFDSQNLIIPMQTHSTNVSFCSAAEYVENCDGIFTNEGKKICSIQVADCMPIFFAHLSEKVYGIIHVGWRGLVNGILDNSAELLVKEDYKLSDFEIFIGPSIQNCCFEVGDDIINNFNIEFVSATKNARKHKVDLQHHAANDLINIGFKNKNISMSTDCTYCDTDKYHSYRRDGEKSGRMIGLIGRAG